MKQNYTLAIDTCCGICSVALGRNDVIASDSAYSVLLYEKIEFTPNRQAEGLLSMINDALAALAIRFQDLNQIVVTVGPGSFTGIRIGLAAVQGIEIAMKSMGLKVDIMPVSTLDSMAMHAAMLSEDRTVIDDGYNDKEFFVAIDAGKSQAYVLRYVLSQLSQIRSAEMVCVPLAIDEITLVNLSGLGLVAGVPSTSRFLGSNGLEALDEERNKRLCDLVDLNTHVMDKLQAKSKAYKVYFFSYGRGEVGEIGLSGLVFPNAAASLCYAHATRMHSEFGHGAFKRLPLEPIYIRQPDIGQTVT